MITAVDTNVFLGETLAARINLAFENIKDFNELPIFIIKEFLKE